MLTLKPNKGTEPSKTKEGRDDVDDWENLLVAADSSEAEEEGGDTVGVLNKSTKKKKKDKPLSPTSTASSFTDFTTNSDKTIPIRNSASRLAKKMKKKKKKNSLLQISEEVTDENKKATLDTSDDISEQVMRIIDRPAEERGSRDSFEREVQRVLGNAQRDDEEEEIVFDEPNLEQVENGIADNLKNRSNDSTVASFSGSEHEDEGNQSRVAIPSGDGHSKRSRSTSMSSRKKNPIRWILLFGLILVAGGIACLVFFVVIPMLKETIFKNEESTDTGNSLASLAESISGSQLLQDLQSPQSKSLDWLLTKDEAMLTPQSAPYRELVERYVVAVLYYSLSDTAWAEQFNFLSADHICSWNTFDESTGVVFGITCNERGNVQGINLSKYR